MTNTPTAKVEHFTRAIAGHQATCGEVLTVGELTITLFDATISLTCSTCRKTFRERFTLTDAATHDPADFERFFQTLMGRAIN